MAWHTNANIKVYAYGIELLTYPGTDTLVAGNAVRQVINNTPGAYRVRDHPVLGPTPTDLSCYVQDIRIKTGRSRALESFPGGTMTLSLDATDRRFDPLSNSGAYAAGVAQCFRKGTPIVACISGLTDNSATALEAPLFSGFIDSIQFNYNQTGGLFSAEVNCVDAFDLLGRVDINAQETLYGVGETGGARIWRWCEVGRLAIAPPTLDPLPPAIADVPSKVGPFANMRYGIVHRPGDTPTTTMAGSNLSSNALTAVKAAAASFDGYVWVDKSGRVGWGYSRTATNTFKFSDTTTATSGVISNPYGLSFTMANSTALISNPKPLYDTADHASVVRLARAGGTEQVGLNTSYVDQSVVEYKRSDLINANDADVLSIAQAMATRHGARPATNVSFEIHPWTDEGAMWFAAWGELTHGAIFEWLGLGPPAALGTGISVTGYVAGIDHDISATKEWTCTVRVTERL